MEQICCIYKITSPINEIYIGQTINLRRRLNSYKNYNKLVHQKRLKDSLIQFGYEKHDISILKICNHDELNIWEEFYIKFFDTFEADYGLNSTSGGKSHKRMKGVLKTSEWKENISNAHKGKKREPFSDEWKQNISNGHKGLLRNETWLNNLKKSAKIRKEKGGYLISEEQKNKFRKSYSIFLQSDKGIQVKKNKGEICRKKFSKAVLQYSMDMVFIKNWDSAREAAANLGIKHPNLVNCSNYKSKSAAGYIWRKENETYAG